MTFKEQSEESATGPVWDAPLLGAASLLAIASASCCVLPIGLSVVGLGGAWLTLLGPFVAYRSFILVGVGLVLLVAWARIINRRNGCAKRRRTAVATASFCTLVFLIALSAPLWEEDAVQAILSYWRGR